MVTKTAAGAPTKAGKRGQRRRRATAAPRARRATARRRAPRAAKRPCARSSTRRVAEFGARGFSDSSIVGITTRAKVALGTFYTYFDSKDAVFAALVRDMSGRVRDAVAPAIEGASDALDAEARALDRLFALRRRA